jgi:SAM-dependent methyltransferase
MSRGFLCPACGATDADPCFAARDLLHRLPGDWSVVRCRACGLKATHPQPDDPSAAYPADYGPHGDAAVGGFRSLAVILPPMAPRSRCIEIGSGAGAFVRHLRAMGHDATGIDPVTGDIKGQLADARLESASIDALFAWQALEHVPDLRATFDEIARVLKPGGWLAFSVPNAGSWEASLFRDLWYNLDVPRHLWHLRVRDLSRLLARDFRILRIAGQRNLSTVLGSLGMATGVRALVDYPQRPSRWLQAALYPLATLVAALGQAGRVTVLAKTVSRSRA